MDRIDIATSIVHDPRGFTDEDLLVIIQGMETLRLQDKSNFDENTRGKIEKNLRLFYSTLALSRAKRKIKI
jgi:hypothetical protein